MYTIKVKELLEDISIIYCNKVCFKTNHTLLLKSQQKFHINSLTKKHPNINHKLHVQPKGRLIKYISPRTYAAVITPSPPVNGSNAVST